MATVQHPTLDDVRRDVPVSDVAKWVKQGWTRVNDAAAPAPKPRPAAAKPAAKPAARKTKRGT